MAKCTVLGAGKRMCLQGGTIKSYKNGMEIKDETLGLIIQVFSSFLGTQLSIQIGVLVTSFNVLPIKLRLGK